MRTGRGMQTTMETDGRSPRAPRARFSLAHRVAAQVLLHVMPAMSVLAAAPPRLPAPGAVVAAPLAMVLPVLPALPTRPLLAMPQSGGGSGTPTAVVVGQALSDGNGLPLAGAVASAVGAAGSAAADADGRYSMVVPVGSTVAIEKTGYTRVERLVPGEGGTATALVDARLTPVRPGLNVSASGATMVDDRVTVTIPSGALAGTSALHLTSQSPQGLPGELPLGWIPVAAFDVRRSSGDAPTLALGLEVRGMPSGALQLVQYSATAHEWVAVSTGLHAAAGTLTTWSPPG